jgi:hypothetical protein
VPFHRIQRNRLTIRLATSCMPCPRNGPQTCYSQVEERRGTGKHPCQQLLERSQAVGYPQRCILFFVGRIGNPSVVERTATCNAVGRHHGWCDLTAFNIIRFRAAFHGRIGNPSYIFLQLWGYASAYRPGIPPSYHTRRPVDWPRRCLGGRDVPRWPTMMTVIAASLAGPGRRFNLA